MVLTHRGWTIKVWPQKGGDQYPPKYAIAQKPTKFGYTFFNREGYTEAECVLNVRAQIDSILTAMA